jgi:hypothetical protein
MTGLFKNKSLWDVMFHNYMDKMFSFINQDPKENKLTLEQFGDLGEDQKFDKTFEKLEETWGECRAKLLKQKEEDRDRNLYFKNFFWTFRWELAIKICFQLVMMVINFTGVYFTGEFFTYLETSDETLYSTATIMTPDSTYYD